jgi:hypothetical protein
MPQATATAATIGMPEAPATEAPAQPVQVLSIKDVALTPEKYLNRKIRLTGTLVNLGTNYFKDRRIALRDTEGNTIEIQPWLPLEIPQGSRSNPPTLAGYLDKRVEIVGAVKSKTTEDGGESLVLDVKSAEVIPPL